MGGERHHINKVLRHVAVVLAGQNVSILEHVAVDEGGDAGQAGDAREHVLVRVDPDKQNLVISGWKHNLAMGILQVESGRLLRAEGMFFSPVLSFLHALLVGRGELRLALAGEDGHRELAAAQGEGIRQRTSKGST